MVKSKTEKKKKAIENLSISVNSINLVFLVFLWGFSLRFDDMYADNWTYFFGTISMGILVMLILSFSKTDESEDDKAKYLQISTNSIMLFVYVFFMLLLYILSKQKVKYKEVLQYNRVILPYSIIAILINFISIFSMSYSVS